MINIVIEFLINYKINQGEMLLYSDADSKGSYCTQQIKKFKIRKLDTVNNFDMSIGFEEPIEFLKITL